MGEWRGLYRGIYAAMLDDPDFQTLSPQARHVLLTLRLCAQNNLACLFRLYLPVLMAQTGYSQVVVERALEELIRDRWIEREQTLVWIRNGLRFDPTVRIPNSKHHTHITRAISAFGPLKIVARFCEYYKIRYPFDTPPIPHPDLDAPIPIPSPIPSPSPSPIQKKNYIVELRSTACRLLEFLNEKAGRRHRAVPVTLEPIMARLREGATEQECKGVIARKVRDWNGDPKMAKYLRPETLFNRTKFESYLGERTRESVHADVSPVQ